MTHHSQVPNFTVTEFLTGFELKGKDEAQLELIESIAAQPHFDMESLIQTAKPYAKKTKEFNEWVEYCKTSEFFKPHFRGS